MQGWVAAAGRLRPAGLVMIMRCGHWWPYQLPLSVGLMHDLADLTVGRGCARCLADWHAATTVPSGEMSPSAD
jgi:hypothetical protein